MRGHLRTRVTEPSNIRWFEKFDIRSSNIESSNHSRIFDHRTGSIIERFDRSNISIFDQGFDIRYSMVRRIEYLNDSKRFDIRWGSMVRYSMVRLIEYLKGSKRFDIQCGSIFDIRTSNIEYIWIYSNLCIIIWIQFERAIKFGLFGQVLGDCPGPQVQSEPIKLLT